jgi:vacuolar-type H+-ATPase subunit B/Vma2
MADTEVTVTVGNLAAEDILVTASPTRIVESRSSQITASVFDGNGNPVAGVPVIFTLESAQVIGPAPTPTGTPTPGPTATPTGPVGNEPTFEHMDSQGSPIFTDSNGRATDVLRTRYPRDAAQRAVVVTATVPGRQLTGTTRVIIN